MALLSCVDDTGEYVQVGITSWGAEAIGTLISFGTHVFFTIELFLIEFYIETIEFVEYYILVILK